MKIFLRIILYVSALLLLNTHALAKNVYVDNENGNDANGGTGWHDAFKTLGRINPFHDLYNPPVLPGDNAYIRATDTPYRIDPNSSTMSIWGPGNFYFDA